MDMPDPKLLRDFLIIVAFALPLLAAIWKIFQVREKVYDSIQTLQHRQEILDARLDAIQDQLLLGLTGNKELIEHKAARFLGNSDRFDDRIEDIEQFLVKTTPYVKRGSNR